MKGSYIRFLIGLVLLCGTGLLGQTFDLQFLLVQNDATVGGTYAVKVQIKANGSTFGLGSSNLVFTYNTAGLSNPTLQTAHNFSGGFYSTMTVTEPVPGRVSINIELLLDNNGTTVPLNWIDVATISFSIVDPLQSSQLQWRTVAPNQTIVFADDNATIIPANNLSGRDDSLPVELSAFSVSAEPGKIVLQWTTQSEINNLGFEVYRSRQERGNYEKIASYESEPALEGAGNSNIAHHYRYADEAVEAGVTYWYKIADVDFRGVRTFHGPVSATAVEALPGSFALHPNFPNPFNPTTQIPFDVPPTQGHPWHITLIVYNALGQKVRTLFTGIIEPGRHQLVWDGRDDFGVPVAGGVYLYRFQADAPSTTDIRRGASTGSGQAFIKVRKMVLLK